MKSSKKARRQERRRARDQSILARAEHEAEKKVIFGALGKGGPAFGGVRHGLSGAKRSMPSDDLPLKTYGRSPSPIKEERTPQHTAAHSPAPDHASFDLATLDHPSPSASPAPDRALPDLSASKQAALAQPPKSSPSPPPHLAAAQGLSREASAESVGHSWGRNAVTSARRSDRLDTQLPPLPSPSTKGAHQYSSLEKRAELLLQSSSSGEDSPGKGGGSARQAASDGVMHSHRSLPSLSVSPQHSLESLNPSPRRLQPLDGSPSASLTAPPAHVTTTTTTSTTWVKSTALPSLDGQYKSVRVESSRRTVMSSTSSIRTESSNKLLPYHLGYGARPWQMPNIVTPLATSLSQQDRTPALLLPSHFHTPCYNPAGHGAHHKSGPLPPRAASAASMPSHPSTPQASPPRARKIPSATPPSSAGAGSAVSTPPPSKPASAAGDGGRHQGSGRSALGRTPPSIRTQVEGAASGGGLRSLGVTRPGSSPISRSGKPTTSPRGSKPTTPRGSKPTTPRGSTTPQSNSTRKKKEPTPKAYAPMGAPAPKAIAIAPKPSAGMGALTPRGEARKEKERKPKSGRAEKEKLGPGGKPVRAAAKAMHRGVRASQMLGALLTDTESGKLMAGRNQAEMFTVTLPRVQEKGKLPTQTEDDRGIPEDVPEEPRRPAVKANKFMAREKKEQAKAKMRNASVLLFAKPTGKTGEIQPAKKSGVSFAPQGGTLMEVLAEG